MSKEAIAWTQFTLGEELFQTGDLANAAQAEQDALRTYPGYHRALAELAKIRAAEGRFEDSVELYQKALAVIPLPTYAAALGDVYTKLGRSREAQKEYDLIEFIAHLSALSKTVYNCELALFYADHDIKLKDALELARNELQVRSDVYTWDCLAWTLYKTGKSKDAAGAITHALAQGTKDANLFFHAGMIYDSLGETEKAREFLHRALTTNPHFHIFYSGTAAQMLRQLEAKLENDGVPEQQHAH